MLAEATAATADQEAWIGERRGRIDAALASLDADFEKILPKR